MKKYRVREGSPADYGRIRGKMERIKEATIEDIVFVLWVIALIVWVVAFVGWAITHIVIAL